MKIAYGPQCVVSLLAGIWLKMPIKLTLEASSMQLPIAHKIQTFQGETASLMIIQNCPWYDNSYYMPLILNFGRNYFWYFSFVAHVFGSRHLAQSSSLCRGELLLLTFLWDGDCNWFLGSIRHTWWTICNWPSLMTDPK